MIKSFILGVALAYEDDYSTVGVTEKLVHRESGKCLTFIKQGDKLVTDNAYAEFDTFELMPCDSSGPNNYN